MAPGSVRHVPKEVAKRMESHWPRALTPEEMSDYKSKMGRRFRVMARHLRQASIKVPRPVWVRQLWGVEEGPEGASRDGPARADPEPEENAARAPKRR